MKTLSLIILAIYSFLCLPYRHPSPGNSDYVLDAEKSVAEWSGASPNTSHQGSFAVTSSGISVLNGQVTGGTFVIPIASLKNFDLPKAIKPVLIKHLKSKDFFNLALYPEATFTLTRVTPLPNSPAGAVAGANAEVTGNFTMIGQTHPITFPARLDLKEENLAVEANFKLDRTQWGMDYAADPTLKNRHIFPEVDIHLKLYGVSNAGGGA